MEIILKEKEKKAISEKIQIEFNNDIKLSNMNKKEKEEFYNKIKQKLIQLSKEMIGEENAINHDYLFFLIFGFNHSRYDIYKSNFIYEIVKKVMKELRREMKCFFIIKRKYVFILKNNSEGIKHKNFLERSIKGLNNQKYNVDIWIKKELWKYL